MKNYLKPFRAVPAGILLLFALALPSCNPPEEGPIVSLSSAEARVEGTWIVRRATETRNGQTTDVTADYNDDSFTFNEDGTNTHSFDGGSSNVTANGHWQLLNNDETFRLTETWTFLGATNTETHDYAIKRLTQKEIFIESREDDVTTRLELGAI